MEAMNKRSSPVSPRNTSLELQNFQNEDNIRPDDDKPQETPSVTWHISPRQPSVPVAETIPIQPSQNLGPGSDWVDGTLRQVQIAGPRSNVPHDMSSIVTPTSRTSFHQSYRPHESLNLNPQIVPPSTPRVAWVNPVTQPYNSGHTQALTTAPSRSVNLSTDVVLITIRPRERPLRPMNLTPVQAASQLEYCRTLYDQEYLTPTDPSLTRRLELASRIIELSVTLEGKYKELDIMRVIELNKEKQKFLHLTQAIGILEKYASNLIKPVRPPYWRSVKFTSNLIQIHIRNMEGSLDILQQMGYTLQTAEGLSFPDDVLEPDIEKIKKLAPDLFLARFDIDALVVNKHPHYEVDPPIPREETELPILFSNRPPPVSRPAQAPNSGPVTGRQQPRIITMRREPQPPPGDYTRHTPQPTVVGAPPMVMERTDGTSGHSQSEPVVTSVRPDVATRKNDNIPTQPLRIATMEREWQPLPGRGGRDVHQPTVGVSRPVVLERADGPLAGDSHPGEGTRMNENVPTPTKRQTREVSRTPSSEQQVESDDSEYEDAQDTLPSGVYTDHSGEPECNICGEVASIHCGECNDSLCGSCDITYHKHKLRQSHKRERIQAQVKPQATVQRSGTSNQTAVDSSSEAPQRSPRARKPVPTPRRRFSNQTFSASSENISSVKAPSPTPRQPRRVGSEPTLETVADEQASKTPGAVTAVAGSIKTQTKDAALGAATSSIAEQKHRSILRPPPYGSLLGSEGHGINGVSTKVEKLQEVKSEQDQLTVHQGIQQLKIAKSEAGQEQNPTSVKAPRTSVGAKSCANCFCLNKSDAIRCVVCGSDLKQDEAKVPVSVPAERKTPMFSSRQFSSDLLPSTGAPQSQRSTLQAFNSQTNTQGFPFSQMMTEKTTSNTAAFPLKSFTTSTCPQTIPAVSTSVSLTYQKSNDQTITARPSSEMQRNRLFSSPQKGAPTDEWACQHCTLLNPATRNVCELCCKTRSDAPKTVAPATRTGNVTTSSATGPNVSAVPGQLPVSLRSNITSGYSSGLPNSGLEPSSGALSLGPHYMPASQKVSPAPMPVFVEEQPNFPPGPPPDFAEVSSFDQLSTQGMFADPRKFPISSKVDQTWQFIPPTTQIYSNEQAMTMPPVMYPTPKDHMFALPPLLPTKEDRLTEAQTRHKEEIYVQGLQFVEWMREAERAGFTVVELNIATNLGCGESLGPVHWLKTRWHDLIHEVLIEMMKNAPDLGNISPEEARKALIEATGDVEEAVKKCTEERKKKLTEVTKKGVFTRADCVSALDNYDGDVEKAVIELQKKAFEPMLQRIKNSCLPDEIAGDALGPEVARQLRAQTSGEQEMFDVIVSNKETDLDRRVRMLLVERCLQSWGRAETAVKLIDRGFAVEDAVDAARQCGDLQRSLRFLQQECPLCFDEKPMSQMITFLNCQDRFCCDCVKQYLAHTISDKNIRFLTCPKCHEPKNLDDESVATEYFNNMDIIIRELLDDRTHDLFQKKVRDRTLMKEPNFRWCSHCSNGFINENPLQLKMQCPHCGKFTCFKCKKQWEDQHQGISCEQFAAWKEANDPERQAAGLASHLRKNGIECPNCKFRYDLAKGGCMHFKCAMCSHEFCSGCYSPFKHGQNCTVSEDCANKGLHAHHPRDCLFYMRDRTPEELQKLLGDNNVQYNTEPPEQPAGVRAADSDDEEQVNEDEAEDPQGAAAQAAGAPGLCKVMEQKEGEDGLVDAHCGAVTPPGYGGLCKSHYTEYLVELINDNFIDPAELMTADELKAVLQREYVAVPEQERRETEENYQQKLLRTLKEKLPLSRKPPRKRILDDGDDDVRDDAHDDRHDDAIGNEYGAIENRVAQPAVVFDDDFDDDGVDVGDFGDDFGDDFDDDGVDVGDFND